METVEYPYDDEYMIFEYASHRYVLTEKYVTEQLGINLAERINERNATSPSLIVRMLLKRASSMVYNYIHRFNINTNKQDFLIAKLPSARKMIMQAMGEQVLYMSVVGDLSMSSDKEKRKLALDDNCKQTLEEILPEIGRSILYSGAI